MPVLKAWVNPLKCPEIDFQLSGSGVPTADRLLDYLFAPELQRGCEVFVDRYRELAAVDDPISMAPAESTILEKLIWPVRQAKGSYALGNYLGCIALCGMVGEMVSILLWDISKVSFRGGLMTKEDQRAILGRTFEQLGQQRRIQVLRGFNLIDDNAKEALDNLRTIRSKYLHLLSQPHTQVALDAKQAFKDTLHVVAVVVGQTFTDGTVVLRADLMAYLTERGLVEAEPRGRERV